MTGLTPRETAKGRGLDCPSPTKTAYMNRRDAKRALRTVKHHIEDKANFKVYRCRCGAFHLGNGDSDVRNHSADWQREGYE